MFIFNHQIFTFTLNYPNLTCLKNKFNFYVCTHELFYLIKNNKQYENRSYHYIICLTLNLIIFFSEVPASTIPSQIKRNFNITNEDLAKLNEKEIEIIDSKIAENIPYLDDLKKVLKRNQAIIARKEKSSLDLMALYKMAKRKSSLLEEASRTSLSKAELEEIKELVTNKCATSKHGINRRTIKNDKGLTEVKRDKPKNAVSESIFAELIKNDPLG